MATDYTDEQLQKMRDHQARNLSPDVLKRNKKKKSATSELEDAILAYLKSIGAARMRISYGVRVLDSGKHIGTGMKGGIPDILCSIPVIVKTAQNSNVKLGIFVGIELKIGADSMSDKQVLRMNEIVAAGGYYFLAGDVDTVKVNIASITKRLQQCFQSP